VQVHARTQPWRGTVLHLLSSLYEPDGDVLRCLTVVTELHKAQTPWR